MRKYQSIWIRIKRDGICTLAAPPSLHRRIRKAVCKEKYKDTGFKIEWDIEGYEQPVLESCTDAENPNIMIFKLLKPITVGEL